MSLEFNDIVTKKGIIQIIEKNCGYNPGDISGNSTLLADFTADVNLAMDYVLALVFRCGGTWKMDDSNHTKDPVIYTDIKQGQRDYRFTTDQQNNVILGISKVFAKDSATGPYRELRPVDVETESNTIEFTNETGAEGFPERYDKMGEAIYLDYLPPADVADGIKLYISRESSYFSASDTIKMPGFAGLFHEFLALRPSFQFAYRNSLANVNRLENEMLKIEKAIIAHYTRRDKDDRPALSSRTICAE